MVRSFAAAALVGLAASATIQKQQLHLRNDWVVLEKASAAEKHTVSIAVKQKNLDLLHDKLMEVSMPDSPQRGKYLTWDEAHQLTANPDATASIMAWLNANGVEVQNVHKHGHYIKAQTDVATWERMLSTSFSRVAKSNGSDPLVRATADVVLPEDIAEHVEGIFMTTQIPPPMNPPPIIKKLDPAENADNVDPAKLKAYYKVTGEGSASATQSVVETINQIASPKDLVTFQQEFDLPSQTIADDIGKHVSDFTCRINPNSCAEANLDVQYIMAMAPGSPLTYWYDSNFQAPFEDWIEAVAATENPPLVHSISYGGPEPMMDASVMNAFNTEAMKLGAQGITIFVSSGDDGVAGNGARADDSQCGYNPSFPATSPYVTAVGATQGGPVNGAEEVACSGNTGGTITTGGGFSTNYAQPDWQASAVADFLARDSSAASGYASGRAYPDVAMAGFNYPTVIGGSTYLVSGTSASAPVVAGMTTLVNARLAEQGKPSVGFINPTIYANKGAAFNDIVTGDNKCTAAGPNGATCCSQGFEAVQGWDAATGWGSVSFDKFSEMLGASSSVVV